MKYINTDYALAYAITNQRMELIESTAKAEIGKTRRNKQESVAITLICSFFLEVSFSSTLPEKVFQLFFSTFSRKGSLFSRDLEL